MLSNKKYIASKISYTLNNSFIESSGENLFIKNIGIYKSKLTGKMMLGEDNINFDSSDELIEFTESTTQ
ncbi:MAG: hypothetical protein U0354_01350 [Candidatus Sericytochromatia bacterium]